MPDDMMYPNASGVWNIQRLNMLTKSKWHEDPLPIINGDKTAKILDVNNELLYVEFNDEMKWQKNPRWLNVGQVLKDGWKVNPRNQ